MDRPIAVNGGPVEQEVRQFTAGEPRKSAAGCGLNEGIAAVHRKPLKGQLDGRERLAPHRFHGVPGEPAHQSYGFQSGHRLIVAQL